MDHGKNHLTYRHHGPGHRSGRHHQVQAQAEVVQTNGGQHGVKLGNGQYVRGGRRQARHCSDQDNVSHTSISMGAPGVSGCVHATHSRQQSGSNSGSLRCSEVHFNSVFPFNWLIFRSGSVQSVSTAGVSEMTIASGQSVTTETASSSQWQCSGNPDTPSCRALAGSLASFECGAGDMTTVATLPTEGVPLLLTEENEPEDRSNSVRSSECLQLN